LFFKKKQKVFKNKKKKKKIVVGYGKNIVFFFKIGVKNLGIAVFL